MFQESIGAVLWMIFLPSGMETKGCYNMKKIFLLTCLLLCLNVLVGCAQGNETSSQSRTDLTADEIRGLSADMARKDVEDLLGQDDDHLAQKEDVDVYSLSDGSTAILRYVDDKLAGAYIRGKDMYEDTIFSKFARDIKENLDEGSYNTENGQVLGDTDMQDPDETNVQDSLETLAPDTGNDKENP